MEVSQELYLISDSAADALAQFEAVIPSEKVVTVTEICSDMQDSWSGSNLGYHANVYYRNLHTPPPGAHFSPEWGFVDATFANPTDDNYVEFDPKDVKARIIQRAEGINLSAIDGACSKLTREIEALQRDVRSILSIEKCRESDDFLEEIGGEISKIAPVSQSQAHRMFLPSGQIMSRDTLAVTQGTRLAPHQEIWADMLMASSAIGSARELMTLARQAAAHIARRPENKKAAASGKKVFIGHGRSPVWRELKDFLRDTLQLEVEEFGRVPTAGVSTTARIGEMLDAAGFAFLLMTPEDETAEGKRNARLNVVHEIGLFQGRLGLQKAIVVLEEGCEEFSNIAGLGQIRYPANRVSAAFEDMRSVLRREGLLKS